MTSVKPERIRQIRGLITHLRHATRDGIPQQYRRDLIGYISNSRHKAPYLVCKWCQRPVARPARYWHKDCATAYRVARGTQDQYWRIPQLKTKRCELCGSDQQLEIDHRVALSVAQASGNWRTLLHAYDVSNLRWLCRTCHGAKSGDDRRRANNLAAGLPEHRKPAEPRSKIPPGQLAMAMAITDDR